MFRENVIEKTKTHVLCSLPPPPRKSCLYEIILENIVERDRTLMTIWRMRIVYWIPKATDIPWECLILITFPRHEWLRERVSMLRFFIHCLSCYSWHGAKCFVSLSTTAFPLKFLHYPQAWLKGIKFIITVTKTRHGGDWFYMKCFWTQACFFRTGRFIIIKPFVTQFLVW